MGIINRWKQEKIRRERKMVEKGEVKAPSSLLLTEEVPRLRGHSKFSRPFRQRLESPSKLMLTGHAISPGHSRALALDISRHPPFPTLERRVNVFIIRLPVTPAAYFIGYGLVNRMFCRDSSRFILVTPRDDLILSDD